MPRLPTFAQHPDRLDQLIELDRFLMFKSIQIPSVEPTMNRQRPPFVRIICLLLISAGATEAQVYKWTDPSGQVHYGQKKPGDAAQVQTLDIVPPSPASPATSADSAAEIARLNALSAQMARERQAAEQARQEQAIRNLEQSNQQLKNDLLNEQLQQQQQQKKDDSDHVILSYPPPYSYPNPYPPHPYPPYPPGPQTCQPWPACRQVMLPAPPPPEPSVKPNPPTQPPPASIAPTPAGVFRGR